MLSHTFAVCAYQDSPYLEACIKSLKRQSVQSNIILCTSTPSKYIKGMAELFNLPLYIREGESDIQEDWNFAYHMAASQLVTIAHQDDCYHRDYVKTLQGCWEKYPDTTVFMTDCAVIKDGEVQKPEIVQFIKHLLRLPLRMRQISDRSWVKKAVLVFGNPIICPSCTYDKESLGEPLFDSPFKFALDWDTLWKLAGRAGRFCCVEKALLFYRIHGDAATKTCIESRERYFDEEAMYAKIWPRPVVALLMFFYKKAYRAYD